MSFILYISAKKLFFVFIQFDEEKLPLDGSNGSAVHSNLGEHCKGSHGYNNFIRCQLLLCKQLCRPPHWGVWNTSQQEGKSGGSPLENVFN